MEAARDKALQGSDEYSILHNHSNSAQTHRSQEPTLGCLAYDRKGRARRFLGQPTESLRSLMLKPFYELTIRHYFRREDFHPAPNVDVVLLHLKRRNRPDLSGSQRTAYKKFIIEGFAKWKDISTASILTRTTPKGHGSGGGIPPEEVRYIQWLCLFKCYGQHVLRRPIRP
jgi:23S rRNA (adenine-N6)-dimethyltransferase